MRKAPHRDSAAELLAFDCDLPHPAEKVWRALTVPQLRDSWLTETAGKGSFDSMPPIECAVLESDPCRLLRLAWRETDPRSGMVVDSVVAFALSRNASGGTHLKIAHERFAVAPSKVTVAAGGDLCRMSLGAATTRLLHAANAPGRSMRAA